MTKKELSDLLEEVYAQLEDMLDPEHTRVELVRGIKETLNLIDGDEEDEDKDEDEQEDDDEQETTKAEADTNTR